MNNYEEIRSAYKQALDYETATTAFGPSMALIKFLDRENTLLVDLGLEGLEPDLETIHQAILTQYSSFELKEMAVESLGTAIETFAKFSGKLVKDGVIGFIRGQIGAKLVLGGLAIGKIVVGKIVRAYKERSYVIPYLTVKEMVKLHDELSKRLSDIAKRFPSNHDQHSWEEFLEFLNGDHQSSYFRDEIDKVRDSIGELNKVERVDFEKSGWNDKNFAAMTKHLVDGSEKLRSEWESCIRKVNGLHMWTKNLDSTQMETADAVHHVLSLIDNALWVTEKLAYRINLSMTQVSHHFTETN